MHYYQMCCPNLFLCVFESFAVRSLGWETRQQVKNWMQLDLWNPLGDSGLLILTLDGLVFFWGLCDLSVAGCPSFQHHPMPGLLLPADHTARWIPFPKLARFAVIFAPQGESTPLGDQLWSSGSCLPLGVSVTTTIVHKGSAGLCRDPTPILNFLLVHSGKTRYEIKRKQRLKKKSKKHFISGCFFHHLIGIIYYHISLFAFRSAWLRFPVLQLSKEVNIYKARRRVSAHTGLTLFWGKKKQSILSVICSQQEVNCFAQCKC